VPLAGFTTPSIRNPHGEAHCPDGAELHATDSAGQTGMYRYG
jgi:hypothetical protein